MGGEGGRVGGRVKGWGVGMYMVMEVMGERDVEFMWVVEVGGIAVGIKMSKVLEGG